MFTIKHVHSLDAATVAFLQQLFGSDPPPSPKLDELLENTREILRRQETLMADISDFESRLQQIDTNTSASAAAAEAVKTILEGLRSDVADAIRNAGITSEQEASILARFDQTIGTTGALRTFLEQTAAGNSAPEPSPVPAPAPADGATA
jgi:hypothetical protein